MCNRNIANTIIVNLAVGKHGYIILVGAKWLRWLISHKNLFSTFLVSMALPTDKNWFAGEFSTNIRLNEVAYYVNSCVRNCVNSCVRSSCYIFHACSDPFSGFMHKDLAMVQNSPPHLVFLYANRPNNHNSARHFTLCDSGHISVGFRMWFRSVVV